MGLPHPLAEPHLRGWTHGVVPTSLFTAYMRVARYACRKPWKGSPMCSQTARRRRCAVLGKAPLTSRDVMMRLIGSMSTTASCINMASNGDLPGMAPHIVGGIARSTTGAICLRMSIHMSLASVVAHTMGLQLSGFAQLPFIYSGCTRFAQWGGTSVFLTAISHRRAARCLFRFSGSLR